jgi:hypothetical protein
LFVVSLKEKSNGQEESSKEESRQEDQEGREEGDEEESHQEESGQEEKVTPALRLEPVGPTASMSRAVPSGGT